MLYRIGEFSKLTGIPIRTLRYYDSIDLFKPSEVDLFTSYRYYKEEQVKDLELINELKEVGFTLEEIRDNWNNFSEELFLKRKEKLLEEIKFKNEAIKKTDILRSKLKDGKVTEKIIDKETIKKKSIF
ncbi:MAG TPA: MerR family transcriptional regulator [Candidatus Onthousia faecipullorum]|uniref:MerR family transcriptional regulator n=1 Tax=Candidatus Onthousia faecipullorum TaxID=2840887 RepID=A0A9D1G9Y7_9FIRM|nr:MerR family transcriptional regulator [Candidatus Onthousia faecipullorum]